MTEHRGLSVEQVYSSGLPKEVKVTASEIVIEKETVRVCYGSEHG